MLKWAGCALGEERINEKGTGASTTVPFSLTGQKTTL